MGQIWGLITGEGSRGNGRGGGGWEVGFKVGFYGRVS